MTPFADLRVCHVEHRREQAVEGFRRADPRAGDDEDHGVARGPSSPVDDLLHDAGEIRRLLIGPLRPDRSPWRGDPPNVRGRSSTGGDVVRDLRERRGVVRGLPLDQERSSRGGLHPALELDVGTLDGRAMRDG